MDREPPPQSGPVIGGDFQLVDDLGNDVTLRTYRGRYVLAFFGFTHCKVVCPRNLARLSSVLRDLGPLADSVAALYISVDPERDTPERMRAFLAGTAPRFTGLTGTRAQVDEAKKAFRVFAERKPDPDDPVGYVVPHTAITYVLDRDGTYITHFLESAPQEHLSQRLEKILTSQT